MYEAEKAKYYEAQGASVTLVAGAYLEMMQEEWGDEATPELLRRAGLTDEVALRVETGLEEKMQLTRAGWEFATVGDFDDPICVLLQDGVVRAATYMSSRGEMWQWGGVLLTAEGATHFWADNLDGDGTLQEGKSVCGEIAEEGAGRI